MLTRNPSGISEVQQEIGAWHVDTFGPTCKERMAGLAKKLEEEHGELQEELAKPFFSHWLPLECADVAIVLFAIADRHGFDLMHEVNKKFAVVRNRNQKARDDLKYPPTPEPQEPEEETP